MLFDTLQLSKDLQESFSPQQSETLARVLALAGGDQLAAKPDIGAVRSEIAALKAELKGDMAAVKARILKEIGLLRADNVRWIVTAIGFNFLATAGLIGGLAKFFGK